MASVPAYPLHPNPTRRSRSPRAAARRCSTAATPPYQLRCGGSLPELIAQLDPLGLLRRAHAPPRPPPPSAHRTSDPPRPARILVDRLKVVGGDNADPDYRDDAALAPGVTLAVAVGGGGCDAADARPPPEGCVRVRADGALRVRRI